MSNPLVSRRQALALAGVAGISTLFSGSRASASLTNFAPAAPETPYGVYPFKVGAYDALVISDGFLSAPTASNLFAPEATPAQRDKVLRDAYLPGDTLNIGLNVLVLKVGSEIVLMDTGYGTLGGPTTGKLVSRLTAAGLPPEKITAVVLTHIHPDHIGALLDPATHALTFPNAHHFVTKSDVDYWSAEALDLSKLPLPADFRNAIVAQDKVSADALKTKGQLIAPGDKILGGLETVDASGHTPGHIGLHLASGSDELLCIGDLAHHHILMFAHPEWTFAGDCDPAQAIKARRRLFDRASADRTLVLGNHMPFPGLGHIARKGSIYEWQPVEWHDLPIAITG